VAAPRDVTRLTVKPEESGEEAFVSGFVAGGIVAEQSEWYDEKRSTVIATATMALTLPSPDGPGFQGAVQLLGRLGFKIGLLLNDGQRVEELLASGVAAAENQAIAADLTRVFGVRPGQHWVGLAFNSPPPAEIVQPNVARYKLRLRLSGARQFPQLVSAPSRYGNEASFSTSYLSALWVIEAPPAAR
jgi:hypothetical protein